MRHHRHRLSALRQFCPSRAAAGIEIDHDSGLARRAGRYLRLGEHEFQILELLLANPGMIYSRERLIAILWGPAAGIDARTVDVKIGRLRKALTLGCAPDPICSVRGKGYKIHEGAEEDYAHWHALAPRKVSLPSSSWPGRRRTR